MPDVSSPDQNLVVVDDVSPMFIFVVLGGFWLLIGVLGYLALG